ncbi:MAG: MFS transporter [Pseudomonadota bacterium]
MTERSDWTAIFAAFFVGVAGAIQVGRVAPVAPILQQDLTLDLTAIGWLVSLITLASAAFGLLAGYLVVRAGLRTSLVIGALAMGVCAVFAALVPSTPVLMGARVIEGLGYLMVVVAAPTLIAREATENDAPFALALWGTFFTLGLSIAAFAGGALSEAIGWHGWFMVSAGLVGVAALGGWLSIPEDQIRPPEQVATQEIVLTLPRASWVLGAAFLGLTLLALSILSLLPTFLVQEHGFTPGASGRVTGSVALASILGSLAYGALANRVSDQVIVTSAAIILIPSVFLAFAAAAEPVQVVTFAAIAVFASGILVAQTFAAVPRIANGPHLIGPTNGLVAQLGSVGALTGPPMIGALITMTGWSAVPFVVSVFSLSFAGLFLLALRSR